MDKCIYSEDNILENSLGDFEPISLEEMKDVELLDRIETKYILERKILADLLNKLSESYRILEIEGKRKNNYHTVYFDTSDLKMYKSHHNGLLNRYKIRVRKYLDSSLSFIEIKFKNNKKQTIKKRVPISNFQNPEKGAWIFVDKKSPFCPEELSKVLENYYTRITLVSKNNIERLTIDINLRYDNQTKKEYIDLPNLMIIEIKQARLSKKSDFIKLMKERSIQPIRFSKYCIGVCSIYKNIKKNNFKEKLRFLNKLNGGKK